MTSEWVEVKGKWRLWQKYSMKLVSELECIWRSDGGEARKWKDCAKRIREKEGGRVLRLPVVTSVHLLVKNISLTMGNPIHPYICSLSVYLSLFHTHLDTNTRKVGCWSLGPLTPAWILCLPSLLSLCPCSPADGKSGLKRGEIVPAHCSLLYQSHALLQMHPVLSSANTLHRPSPLVSLFSNDFI